MGAAAAVILMKERQVVETFERAGATAVGTARSPTELGVDPDGVGWRRLRERAIVREARPDTGLYYLDVEVWQATRRVLKLERGKILPRRAPSPLDAGRPAGPAP